MFDWLHLFQAQCLQVFLKLELSNQCHMITIKKNGPFFFAKQETTSPIHGIKLTLYSAGCLN